MTFCVSVCRGGSSVGAASGLSGETEERTWVIKRCVEKEMEVAESRRGYIYGAAWDEGNMIQAMARLKNPTIVWRYGDGYSATWCFRNRPSGPASLFLISSQETGHLASQFLRSNKKLSLRTLRYALSNAYTRYALSNA